MRVSLSRLTESGDGRLAMLISGIYVKFFAAKSQFAR
jgi:hypothetical protein